MNLYEKLPNDFLIDFYNEICKNIENGILTKAMYYELGLITMVLNQRGIILSKPTDFEDVVKEKNITKLIS
ncbi:hypothetical protein [Neobacillus cucumis]|uniref:hypothetical protein n=1 Tax=Neobacillus cucumis TaxID=1740721 RepID=UPI001965C9AA|nr:hypothetical protein [Neobacillus cucumis]MBM7655487.1 hypothetical protein [Neobacillus cucumis]